MGKNAFCVVMLCGRSNLPFLSQVAEHKQHVSSLDDDHFYLKLKTERLLCDVFSADGCAPLHITYTVLCFSKLLSVIQLCQ